MTESGFHPRGGRAFPAAMFVGNVRTAVVWSDAHRGLGGLRPRLQDRGITFEGNLTQFGFGLSGVNRPSAYTGRGDYAFTFDLVRTLILTAPSAAWANLSEPISGLLIRALVASSS